MKETDIRPKEMHQRYLELSLKDSDKMDINQFVSINCPGCNEKQTRLKFKKNNFNYVYCESCGSVYCSPRPTQDQLNSMYCSGESSHYWANVFFPAVAEQRREKLFRKKAKRIGQLFEKSENAELNICDVGAGYGIFLEELKTFFPSAIMHAIELNEELAKKCKEKGFDTLQIAGELAHQWENKFDLVISSEVIEHVFDTHNFIRALYNLAKPKGNVLITGLGYEGFDNLTLQEKSKAIFPPHHINFLSIGGFEKLFKNVGFSEVKIWTPGELDVDIVMRSDNPPEFLKVMSKRSGVLEEFQKFLSKHRLSSHIWALAKK